MRKSKKIIITSCLWVSLLLGGYGVLPAEEINSQEQADISIPVLCYHRFGPIASKNYYALSTEEFEKHLAMFKQEGFVPMTPSQVMEALDKKRAWPEKPMMITVDDGYHDFMTYAKPGLDRYGYKATLFVYTDFVDSRLGFSKQQLKQLVKEGYEIGSHSATHSRLSKWEKGERYEQHKERLQMELAGSKKKLSEWSGQEIISCAYPYGLWDEEVADLGKEAGYQLMLTVCPGSNGATTPAFRWHRYMIVKGLKVNTLKKFLYERPLQITNQNPRPGQHVAGPIKKITASIPLSFLKKIDIKTLVAKSGRSVYPLKIDVQTGDFVITLTKPWTKGTDQITVMATDSNGHRYKESWLMMVDPSRAKGYQTDGN